MVKFIPSKVHLLKKELVIQNQKFRKLEDEIQHKETRIALQNQYIKELEQQLNLQSIIPTSKRTMHEVIGRNRRKIKNITFPDSLGATPTPTYMQSTKASAARNRQTVEVMESVDILSAKKISMTAEDISYENDRMETGIPIEFCGIVEYSYSNMQWEDGKLLRNFNNSPHYLSSTITSEYKRNWSQHSFLKRRIDVGETGAADHTWANDTVSVPSENLFEESSTTDSEHGDNTPHLTQADQDNPSPGDVRDETFRNSSPIILEDLTDFKDIASHCGLFDISFFQTPAGQCYIPVVAQFKILQTVYRLAQRAMWNYSRRNWSESYHYAWPESPLEIDFGRDKLLCVFGYPSEYGSDLVQRSSFEVVKLRNCLSHPNSISRGSRVTDYMIRSVMPLAIHIRDYEMIRRLQKLRLQLQKEARKSLAYIDSYAPWSVLPHSQPCQVHLGQMLAAVSRELRGLPARAKSYWDDYFELDRLPESIRVYCLHE